VKSNCSDRSIRCSSKKKNKKEKKKNKKNKKNKNKKEEILSYEELLMKDKIKENKYFENQHKTTNNYLVELNENSIIDNENKIAIQYDLLKNKRLLSNKSEIDDTTQNDFINKQIKDLKENEKIENEKIENENIKIDEINTQRKANIKTKLQSLFELALKGDKENFDIKYANLEKLAKTKENFLLKKFVLKKKSNKDDNMDKNDSYQSISEEEKNEGNEENLNLRKNNFYENDDFDAKYAYDKNRKFLNSDVNLKLKTDLISMNEFNSFEKKLKINEYSKDNHSRSINQDNLENTKNVGITNKEGNLIKGKFLLNKLKIFQFSFSFIFNFNKIIIYFNTIIQFLI